ncbi:MAG: hypothetical protein ABIZ81_14645 [Opitutaceae bacterium]
MTAVRWGLVLVSLGLILPRLLGGDAPATTDTSEPRVGSGTVAPISKDASTSNLAIAPKPAISVGARGQAKSSAQVRAAVLEGFSYGSSVLEKRREQSSPVLVLAQPEPNDSDVVVMANFEVAARVYERGLPAAIANWRDPSPQNDGRFGTGMHQKDFGKVRASVVTILYVPILFGISW